MPEYRATDLGEFIALDVNDHGQVAGQETHGWGSVLYTAGRSSPSYGSHARPCRLTIA